MKITVDPITVKAESETAIRSAGGKICDWLPCLDRAELRPADEIIGRALVMNALLNIYFKAPIPVVAEWILKHGLTGHLSNTERDLLRCKNDALSEQQLIDLFWYIEALWALMWVGSLIDDLPFQSPVEDRMASMCPNLEKNEGPQKFTERMRLRKPNKIFQMLDLYFRVHWWARDGQINGYTTKPADLDIVMERRKALEWVLNPNCNWDDVPLNT
ncbi:MAG: DUF4272 domain-containing protein [Burkholderiales bacterium]|nr:DUF4272 domain-containing protein [Burkholderiales bacterium]